VFDTILSQSFSKSYPNCRNLQESFKSLNLTVLGALGSIASIVSLVLYLRDKKK